MSFIFNLFRREIRSSWRRLLFFFLCIAIGVGSVVALRSLIQNLSFAVAGDARSLMTADFEISSTNPFSPTELSTIDSIISPSKIVEARNEAITTTTMARAANGFSQVELKGIENTFPLVSNFVLADGKPFDFSLLENQGAVVQNLLLEKLNVKIGDYIQIGKAEFQIRAGFDEEPGGASGFRLGPRVFIEKKGFDATGLTSFGSRLRRRILYRTSTDPTALVKQLRDALKGTTVTVASYKEAQENLGEQFNRTENYLSLTGLLILVLGGIGVWNVARVFVEQKRKTIAVLKCLGADSRKVIFVYLFQILTLGFAGSFCGILLAQSALWLTRGQFGAALPKSLSYQVSFAAAWQGILLGVLISLLFSMLPLLQIRNIKPNLLLREGDATAKTKRLDLTRLIFAVVTIAGLLGLAAWQAGSVIVGSVFLVSVAVTALILYAAATALTRVLRGTKKFSSFSVAQAINSLYRPGNQTRVVLLAVGLGAFVVLGVRTLQSNLVKEFDFSLNEKIPALFMVDIQRSQVEKIKEMTLAATGENVQPVPTIRARVASVNGEPFDFQQKEVRQQQGQIGREFAVTYRPNLDANETVIAGKFWDASPSPEAEVSVEEGMSQTLGVGVGDYITFDILGRRINALVTSIRKIDLRNTRTAFVFVFRPGVLENAPQTFVLPITKKLGATDRLRFQREVLDAFPNVQIFDVADILTAIGKLINNFVLAISFIGSFVMLTGILILIGSVALTKSQRIYENAMLKTLGARRATLLKILVTEYAILGTLAGAVGAFFAALMSFAVTKFIFKIDWQYNLVTLAAGVLVTALLVTIVGTLVSFSVLFKKPLSVLRSQ